VRDADEARQAIDGGADIVDVKEPDHGSLGAAESGRWWEVAAQCASRIPVSVALGELLDGDLPARLALLPRVQFAKIGLAGCRQLADWIPRWRRAVEQLPTGTQPVAVYYADADRAICPTFHQVLSQAVSLGCCGLLWDTHEKRFGSLLDQLPIASLAQQMDAVRQRGMHTVLAGSLSLKDLLHIERLSPDFVAVRGAVCARKRTGRLRGELVRQFADSLQRMQPQLP
jgi:uncharacterized protein (UPF0264 family)